MIELDRGQDDVVREVMIELGDLVPERGIVLVPFQNEGFAGLERGDLKTIRKILGYAADEIARIAAGMREDVSEQARRRGFTVRPGDNEIPRGAEHELFHRFGKRRIG